MSEDKSNSLEVGESAVRRLAKFFPDAVPVRVPVRVSADGGREERETTVVEFATRREALFACRMPLEFAEKISLEHADGSTLSAGWVVAMHFYSGQAAVAVRFTHEVANWVVKS